MIFQHTWQKVMSGKKTQTRRLVKPGQYECAYKIGQSYAMQPGRGKPAIARIQITSIRREDVRTISEKDVKAEGFDSQLDFWSTWVEMHDKSLLAKLFYTHDYLRYCGFFSRPVAKYDAWVIEFELCKGAVNVNSITVRDLFLGTALCDSGLLIYDDASMSIVENVAWNYDGGYTLYYGNGDEVEDVSGDYPLVLRSRQEA